MFLYRFCIIFLLLASLQAGSRLHARHPGRRSPVIRYVSQPVELAQAGVVDVTLKRMLRNS